MSLPRLVPTLAAAATGALLLVAAAPAAAQQATQCPGPGNAYPPGQCAPATPPGQGGENPGTGGGTPPGQIVSDTTPGRGQAMTVGTGRGQLDPGSRAEYGMQSTYIRLGTTTVAPDGSATATFTVPTTLSNGAHTVVFSGLRNGQPATVRIPVTVTGGAPFTGSVSSGRGGALGALPTTGSDEVVPLAATGIALVVAGAAVVVVARRRRQDLELPVA